MHLDFLVEADRETMVTFL